MSPAEPPLSVYAIPSGCNLNAGSGGDTVSIYGTMPRRRAGLGIMAGGGGGAVAGGGGLHHRIAGCEFSPAFPFQYATMRTKETLSARPSLKSLGLMEDDSAAEDRMPVLQNNDDGEGSDDSSGSSGEESLSALRDKLADENLAKITRGITFHALRTGVSEPPNLLAGSRTSKAQQQPKPVRTSATADLSASL